MHDSRGWPGLREDLGCWNRSIGAGPLNNPRTTARGAYLTVGALESADRGLMVYSQTMEPAMTDQRGTESPRLGNQIFVGLVMPEPMNMTVEIRFGSE